MKTTSSTGSKAFLLHEYIAVATVAKTSSATIALILFINFAFFRGLSASKNVRTRKVSDNE